MGGGHVWYFRCKWGGGERRVSLSPLLKMQGLTLDLNRGAGHGFVGEKEGIKTGTAAGLAGVCRCIASKLGRGR